MRFEHKAVAAAILAAIAVILCAYAVGVAAYTASWTATLEPCG